MDEAFVENLNFIDNIDENILTDFFLLVWRAIILPMPIFVSDFFWPDNFSENGL